MQKSRGGDYDPDKLRIKKRVKQSQQQQPQTPLHVQTVALLSQKMFPESTTQNESERGSTILSLLDSAHVVMKSAPISTIDRFKTSNAIADEIENPLLNHHQETIAAMLAPGIDILKTGQTLVNDLQREPADGLDLLTITSQNCNFVRHQHFNNNSTTNRQLNHRNFLVFNYWHRSVVVVLITCRNFT